MENQIIERIEAIMKPVLNLEQQRLLNITLIRFIKHVPSEKSTQTNGDLSLVKSFIAAKRVEGCSDKTVHYYESTISNVLITIGKKVEDIQTDDLRLYLDEYQTVND